MTYLFYDIETTGLNFAFDQVLQFAAIRTDRLFREIERHELLVKLRPDVIPSPEAMLSHCISPKIVADGLSEYEAITRIHVMLNEPETISIGYNTLKFDDEFLRFAFHRNLLPPYTHQYANNCGRMDLLPMTVLFWLYRTSVLEWPELDGKVSLKLEQLKEANQLAQGSSHDALVDVEASVALARKLAKEADMWHYAADYFHKGVDKDRTSGLKPLSERLPEVYKLAIFVKVSYGAEFNFQAPVIFIGYSDKYSNQSLWLRLDRPELLETTAENIAEKTWVERKKFGEPGILLPAKDRFFERIVPKAREAFELNKQWLENNLHLLQEISKHHAEFKYEEIPDVDVDGALYQMDFHTHDELELCRQFHLADLPGKVAFIGNFGRPEMKQLGQRILFRNFDRKELGDHFHKEREAFDYQVNPVFEEEAAVDYRGNRKLLPRIASQQIDDLKENVQLGTSEIAVLDELQSYIKKRFPGS